PSLDRVVPVTAASKSPLHSNAKSPDGPGDADITSTAPNVSGRCAKITYAAESAQRIVRLGDEPAGRRPEGGGPNGPLDRPRRRCARRRPGLPPADRRDRPAGAAETARRGAR